MSQHAPPVLNDAKPHYQDINAPAVVLLTAVSAILTYAMIALAQGYYFQWKNNAVSKQNASTVSAASDYLEGQKSALAEGATERKIKPIGASMEKTVQKWSAPSGH